MTHIYENTHQNKHSRVLRKISKYQEMHERIYDKQRLTWGDEQIYPISTFKRHKYELYLKRTWNILRMSMVESKYYFTREGMKCK